jgi:hypothetical protein
MTGFARGDRSMFSDDRLCEYAQYLYKWPNYLDDPDEITERNNYAIEGIHRPRINELPRRNHFRDPFDPEPVET